MWSVLYQGLQKANYDKKAKVARFVIGQHIMDKNFRDGPTWVLGVIVKQLGMLNFLVQLDSGQFWKRHSNQLHYLEEMRSDETVLMSAPVVTSLDIDTDNSVGSPNSEVVENSPVAPVSAPQIKPS